RPPAAGTCGLRRRPTGSRPRWNGHSPSGGPSPATASGSMRSFCCSAIVCCPHPCYSVSWVAPSASRAPDPRWPTKGNPVPDQHAVEFETRMLIDGKLTDGEAGTFGNINPANEQMLGEVADASKDDMRRAIDAARRAFDESDWSTNRAFRQRCLLQLQAAL